ncbi:MAG: YmdB family metallophosphoesterase [Nitrospira sp.]|nr:YmdB family metallophosphoesterase [Nitrospira sp.]
MGRMVPRVVSQRQVDIVVNAGKMWRASGFRITRNWRKKLEMGLSVITTGNHAWDKKEILDYFPREPRLLRPANYPAGVPGNGSYVVKNTRQ